MTARLCVTILVFARARYTPQSTPPNESNEPEMSAQDERDQGREGELEVLDREVSRGDISGGERGGDISGGERVEKGQVLASMYSDRSRVSSGCEEVDCSPSSLNAHIHFELNGPQGKMSPSIFTSQVSSAFRARINEKSRDSDCPQGNTCEDVDYQACRTQGGMGYKLTASENPLGDERVHCQ